MTVSKDVRTKEYDGARSASRAFKIEKVETHANIKVQASAAAADVAQANQASGAKTDANVVDLKLGHKSLKDFGVDLTSDSSADSTPQDSAKDGPLKAMQPDTSGPSYKVLIGVAAGLVVVIAGLAFWSTGIEADQTAAVAPMSAAMTPQGAVEAQTSEDILISAPVAQVASVSENEFVAQMTAGTIAALRAGAKTPAVAQETVLPATGTAHSGDAKLAAATLFSMVLDATAKDLSLPEIDHMLNIAYADGTIKVPEPFLLSSGRVNTNAIMTAFVGQ